MENFYFHHASFSLYTIIEDICVCFVFIIFYVPLSVWDGNIYGGQLLMFYYLINDYLFQQS
jgi:hypothetical protein